jgi:hypothetical protein
MDNQVMEPTSSELQEAIEKAAEIFNFITSLLNK